jgi:hypothetical protein
MLEVSGLVKTYPTGDRALRGVSFSIKTTEVVFVIGPSGAGKSTLLRCINRLVEPDAGSVRLDGVEITRLTGAELRRARRHMAMIFQEFNLVERLTVMENVLSGRLGYVGLWHAWRRRFPPKTSNWHSRRWPGWDWPDSRTSGPMRCPGASASGSESPVPWSSGQRSCWSTSRRRASTPGPRKR